MTKLEWDIMCEVFCKKFGYKLIFANANNCDLGFEYNGQFYHLDIYEMEEKLKEVK